jgi:para-aminobenzoate synthetase/4-amino-4-deoxychorismate lyase
MRCRAVSYPLGVGPPPAQVIAHRADAAHLAALVGEWGGGGALIAAEPLVVLPADADALNAVRVLPHVEPSEDVVGGGWFGWFGFDAPPFLAFYDHLLRWRDGRWWFEALWSDEREAVLRRSLDESAALLTAAADAVPRTWKSEQFGGASLPVHLEAVERAVEWIRAGEVYQVNVCTRLHAGFAGDAAAMFAASAARLAPRFGAYIDGGERALACLSPELFLRRRGRDVMTSPIKGTAPRHGVDGSDALLNSAKDAAENVMIVDLMRNDLGRVCEIGSVRTASLLDLEAHPGVWHLVSTVTGRLRAEVDDSQLLAATLPPGSVTGAPKLRALDAIAELETVPRGVYTGAIGFASPAWGTEFAVAIRTFEIAGDRIDLGVGGGVTADSVPMREWRECLDKAAPLLRAIDGELHPAVPTPVIEPTGSQLSGGLLETVLVIDGVPVRLADHLARLDRSSRELYACPVPAGTAVRAAAAAAAQRGAPAALRIVLTTGGGVAITCRRLTDPPGESDATVVHRASGLWRHKWADRADLAAAEHVAGTPLFVADDGTVLETSRGNVFLICPDGSLRTPPLRDDVLPGITRRAVLDVARDSGRRAVLRGFTVTDLHHHAAFWTSSLSGVVPIRSVDGVVLPRRDEVVVELARALNLRGKASGARPTR